MTRGWKGAAGLALAMSSAFQAVAQPATWSTEEVQTGLRSAFEIAADPAAWSGRQVTVTCQLMLADLRAAQCPVWNHAGQPVGSITVLMGEATVSDRKRVAQECTSMANVERCAAIVSGKFESDAGSLRINTPRFGWMRGS